jgi:cell division septum initiation protein DivIVA
MDILHLLDRMEKLLLESRRIPMTASIIVDEDRLFNILDQMRANIPEEVKKASRIYAEKDRVMAQTREEAERIKEIAKKEADELVNRDSIVKLAQDRAEKIDQRARNEAARLRDDADIYALNQLSRLEDDLLRSLTVVRNGLHKLRDDHTEFEAASKNEPAEDLEPQE